MHIVPRVALISLSSTRVDASLNMLLATLLAGLQLRFWLVCCDTLTVQAAERTHVHTLLKASGTDMSGM